MKSPMRRVQAIVGALLAVVAFSALMAGCGDDEDSTDGDGGTDAVIDPGDGGDYDPEIDPADFVTDITNAYLPLTPGSRWVYEGEDDGELERIEIEVLTDRREVMGISAVVVRDTVYDEDGELVEDTYDWFAQDSEGNVWYLGEESTEYEDGEAVSTEGSWEAGVDGALPGIVMLADPEVGEAYRQEYYEDEAEDMAEVSQVGVTEGDYTDVIVIREWNPLEPDVIEDKYYAPGVGVIAEVKVEGAGPGSPGPAGSSSPDERLRLRWGRSGGCPIQPTSRGQTMSALVESETQLGYLVNDADQHSTPPVSAYVDYVDPAKRHLAITEINRENGKHEYIWGNKPDPSPVKSYGHEQVVGSGEVLSSFGVDERGRSDELPSGPVPGSLLTRLNPLKGLDDDGRAEFARRYRELQPMLDNPSDRLAVMDSQEIEAAVNFAALPGIEVHFEDDFDALYANLNALNRYLGEVWGYNHQNRLFTPPFVSFADPQGALDQLERIMAIEVPKVIQTSTGPSMHTSPFRPDNDRFWEICSEAGIGLSTHLASVTRYGAQGLEWSEEEVILGDMNAFQWVFYYGDRPAMETVGAAILQGWFARFPKMKLMLAEQGTVWLPYLLRKMNHAFMMGRKASWGSLEMRPSEYFREHCFVAPFPEENLDRVIAAVGVEPIVFGSDFPHGEGLPDPSVYVSQLGSLSEADARSVMRGNMARFLDLDD
jgi:predicted TIM-barrel fold metal-dependent hydrolase